jgi:hypothetical protein
MIPSVKREYVGAGPTGHPNQLKEPTMPLFEVTVQTITTKTLLLKPSEVFEYIKKEYVSIVGTDYQLLEVNVSNYPHEIRIFFVDSDSCSEPDEDFKHGQDDSYEQWTLFIDKMREDFGCYVNVPGYYWSK